MGKGPEDNKTRITSAKVRVYIDTSLKRIPGATEHRTAPDEPIELLSAYDKLHISTDAGVYTVIITHKYFYLVRYNISELLILPLSIMYPRIGYTFLLIKHWR